MPAPVTDTDSSSDDELLASLIGAKSSSSKKKKNQNTKSNNNNGSRTSGGGDNNDGSDNKKSNNKKRKKLKQLKRMKKKQKKHEQQRGNSSTNNKESRRAEARAEVAQLAQARKERKIEATKAKKAASAVSYNNKAAATTTTGANNNNKDNTSAGAGASALLPFNKDDPVVGYCDICQLTEKYKPQYMSMLRCTSCGVTVHDVCYGISGFGNRFSRVGKNKNPASDFQCWACKAVGRIVKVRDKDPFTGEYIEVKQKSRPYECCLCDIDDGVHAMHPVYDIHGSKGRQIYLPKDDDDENGNKKPRRLAWCHTLCAMTLCQTSQCQGAVFGCGPDGDCGYESDQGELLSDSESVNSDLVDAIETDETSHFVWWGHIHRFVGADPKSDPFSKSLVNLKDGSLRCSYCGKNDQKKTRLPSGQYVYQSLRVPIQCSANNPDEADIFKKHHKTTEDGPCTVGLHVGCAVWGRNDEGEYRRPRACWFFPGLDAEGTPGDPVTEVYCRCHSEELFCLPTLSGSDMSDRLPGPFETLSGPAQERFLKNKTKKKKNNNNNNNGNENSEKKSTKLTGGNDDNDNDGEYKSYASGSTGGMSAVSSTADNLVVRGCAAADKHPHASRARSHTPQSRTKKRPSSTSSSKLSLHGETKKKKMATDPPKKADKAVKIQTKRKSSNLFQGGISSSSSSAQQQAHKPELDVVQDILDQLVKRREECYRSGKPFDTPELAMLRVQLYKKFFNGSKEEFGEVWRSANKALNDGILDVKAHVMKKNADRNDDDDNDDDAVMMMEGDDGMKGCIGGTQSTDDIEAKGCQSQSTGEAASGGEAKGNSDADNLQQRASKALMDNPHAELAERITNDILAALHAEGQTSHVNSSFEVVKEILKKRKSHWKKASGLPKAEYKTLFAGKIAARLYEVSGWLDITGSDNNNKTQQPTHEDDIPQQAHDVAIEDPTANKPEHQKDEFCQPMDEEQPASTDHAQPESSKECGENREGQGNQSLLVDNWPEFTAQPQTTIKPPSRWSFLHYGPYYNKEGFRFDKWDTYEEIDRLTSDDEEQAPSPANS